MESVSVSFKQFLYAAISFALLVAFAFQVKESVEKFLAGRSTSSQQVEAKDAMPLPALSICPGFKGVRFEFGGTDLEPSYFAMNPTSQANITQDQLTSWWRGITFSLQETFVSIVPPRTHNSYFTDKPFYSEVLRTGLNEAANLTIQQVSTTFGSCYTLTYHSEVPERTSINIHLNMTLVDEVTFYIHNPGDEIGLFNDYWPLFVYSGKLGRTQVDLELMKEVHKVRGNKMFQCKDDDSYEYGPCITSWAKKAFLRANCSEVCWIPQALYISDPSLKPCLTRNSTQCILRHLFHNVMAHLNTPLITGCSRPCRETHYLVKANGYPHRGLSSGNIFLFHESTIYNVHEEYLLFDLNAIVAAVGGSLGLFLGFSCRDLTNALVGLVYNVKRRAAYREEKMAVKK